MPTINYTYQNLTNFIDVKANYQLLSTIKHNTTCIIKVFNLNAYIVNLCDPFLIVCDSLHLFSNINPNPPPLPPPSCV